MPRAVLEVEREEENAGCHAADDLGARCDWAIASAQHPFVNLPPD